MDVAREAREQGNGDERSWRVLMTSAFLSSSVHWSDLTAAFSTIEADMAGGVDERVDRIDGEGGGWLKRADGNLLSVAVSVLRRARTGHLSPASRTRPNPLEARPSPLSLSDHHHLLPPYTCLLGPPHAPMRLSLALSHQRIESLLAVKKAPRRPLRSLLYGPSSISL